MASNSAGSVTLLDAGFSTQLATHTTKQIDGHPLWTARFLLADKDLCIKVHREFIKAGSKIIRTNSYQATVPGFVKHMKFSENEAIRIIKESVMLAKRAIELEEESVGKKLNVRIAGSIGPYGAHLHDGSEYTGAYCQKITQQELIDYHRPKLKALIDGGVDLLALETIPCSIEAITLIELLKEFPKAKAWLSFSIKNESQISNGENFAEVACNCWNKANNQLIAVGANCVNPVYVTPLFTKLLKKNPSIPFIAYPNSGELYDGKVKKWIKQGNSKRVSSYVEEWLNLGVSFVGGCCRTTNMDLHEISRKITNWQNKVV